MSVPNVFPVAIPALTPVQDPVASILLAGFRAPDIVAGTMRSKSHLIEASAEEFSRIKFKSHYPERITDAEIAEARLRFHKIGREILIGEGEIKDAALVSDTLNTISQQFKVEMERHASDFKREMQQLRADIKTDSKRDMDLLRADIKEDLEKFRADIKEDLEKFRADIKTDSKRDMDLLRADSKGDMDRLKAVIKVEMDLLKEDMRDLKREARDYGKKIDTLTEGSQVLGVKIQNLIRRIKNKELWNADRKCFKILPILKSVPGTRATTIKGSTPPEMDVLEVGRSYVGFPKTVGAVYRLTQHKIDELAHVYNEDFEILPQDNMPKQRNKIINWIFETVY